MAFFKKKTDADSIKEDTGNGGKYISKSGIYDLEIIVPMVAVNAKGAATVDLFVNYNGQKQPLYGNMRLQNNDGSENFGAKIFNKLCIIADVDPADPVEAELPIGKKSSMKDCSVLEDMADITCKVRVQMEYSIYNGDIKEKTIIKSFYREDGASAEEIVNESDIGVQLEKDMPYAENVTYKDGLDATQITEWIAAKRPKGTANGGSAAASTTEKPSFSGKRKFGSK